MSNQPWYVGAMSPDDVLAALAAAGNRVGDFVVRDSQKAPGSFAIVVMCGLVYKQ